MISDGTVYVGSDGGLGAPGLYAISIETGEELWVFPTENGVQSSPALADGVVYFGSRDKNLYALDERTGEGVWRFETGGGVETGVGVGTVPGLSCYASISGTTWLPVGSNGIGRLVRSGT